MHCHLRCFSWHCSSTMVHSRVLSFQFISDLEIAHFWLLCHKLFCFGHSFWTKAYFSILLSQVINIFPVQWIDTNIDHLYSHIRVWLNMATNMVHIGVCVYMQCRLQNPKWLLGGPKMAAGSGNTITFRLLDAHVNFCKISFLIWALLLWEKKTTEEKITSLAAKGARINRLQHLTACLIQNGQQGLERV